MYFKKHKLIFWFIAILTFFLQKNAFAIVETTHTRAVVSLKTKKLAFGENSLSSIVKQKMGKVHFPQANTTNQKADDITIVGFSTGLGGILLILLAGIFSQVALIIAGFVAGIAGIILSAIALKKIKRDPQKRKGLARAGLILSIIDVTVFILFLIAVIVALTKFQ